MKLTDYDLEVLQKNLETTLQVVKDIRKPLNIVEPRFHSRQEYLEALQLEGKMPEQLYNFRFKDVYICIRYSEKTDLYHIVCKNFYSNVLNQFKTYRSESWILTDSLDYAKLVFSDVIQDFFDRNILKDGLF